MKSLRAMSVLTLCLALMSTANADSLDPNTFAVFGKFRARETKHEEPQSAYMSYDKALSLARQERKGILVLRRIPKEDYGWYARKAVDRGVIFCVAADDDTRVEEGGSIYSYDLLFPAVSEVAPEFRPVQIQRGGSC